jgi:hypothetical protein
VGCADGSQLGCLEGCPLGIVSSARQKEANRNKRQKRLTTAMALDQRVSWFVSSALVALWGGGWWRGRLRFISFSNL